MVPAFIGTGLVQPREISPLLSQMPLHIVGAPFCSFSTEFSFFD